MTHSKRAVLFTRLEPQVREFEKVLRAAHPDLDLLATWDVDAARHALEQGAEILLGFTLAFPPSFVVRAPGLRWIHALGTGVDGAVDQEGLAPDIIITATRGIHGPALSEAAFTFMLGHARQSRRAFFAQTERRWDRSTSQLLSGKTIGILGTGLIAVDLAPRCKAFGMTVIGFSRSTRALPGFDRVEPRERLHEIAAQLDHLVLLVPYDASSHHIVDAALLKALKPSCLVINLARGGVIDEDALAAALESGEIGGAGLDAFVQEPLPTDHPLWQSPNVLITAHTAGMYDNYVDCAIPQFSHNLACYERGAFDEMTNREFAQT